MRFSHGRVLFDSRNVQKRATKSDTLGHCLGLVLSPSTLSFMGNQIWADDRLGDLCACVGSGNLVLAMSQHPRLGRDSWLGRLSKETLRVVVSFLL